jgi:hypothetical protein
MQASETILWMKEKFIADKQNFSLTITKPKEKMDYARCWVNFVHECSHSL